MKRLAAYVFATLVALVATLAGSAPAPDELPLSPAPPPRLLSETGLFEPGGTRVRAGLVAFAPQYPLWTDGLAKRRWLSLPAGTAIDATDPEAWRFPPGTQLWKEFATDRPVETRLIERLPDGSWRFSTYVWNAAGTDAELAPEAGVAVAAPGLPGGRHQVPGRGDCLACHDAGAGPVLGLSTLQLSPARDPLAPHAAAEDAGADLDELVARGWLANLPASLLETPPRIAAPSATARAALGYLHGNCGHCHNDRGPLASLDLSLAQRADADGSDVRRTLESLVGRASRFRAHAGAATARIGSGPGNSVLSERMQSANPFARMPPLGVQVVDADGVALIERWIREDLAELRTAQAAAPRAASPTSR